MPRVELIYDEDCPNVAQTREALREAFARAGMRPAWSEWDRKGAASPDYVRGYGSPTVLVDGRDVAGAAPIGGADCCRVYRDDSGSLRGVPPVEDITRALRGGRVAARAGSWGLLASPLGIGTLALPVGACPACWPIYAGTLGALGLGFLLDAPYLLPLALALLGLALFALVFRARARRGYGPPVLGAVAVGMLLAFKFALAVDALAFAGLAGLIAASVWNAWPRRAAAPCAHCAAQPGTDTASPRRR